MSASREKKTRQDDPSGGMTEKQRRDMKEAQKAKNKKILYWVCGIVAVVLVIALLVWDSGLFQRRTAAATVGDKTYTVADVSFYYSSTQRTLAQYAGYGLITYDSSKSPAEQVLDATAVSNLANYFGIEATEGETFHDVFQREALDALQYEALMCDQAKAQGYTLSDEGKQQVEDNLQSYKDAAKQQGTSVTKLLQANYGKYLTESVFKTRLTNAQLASEFEQHQKDSYNYSDAELDAYYQDHKSDLDTYDYRVAFVSGTPEAKTDDAGNAIEATADEKAVAMQQAKAKADAMAEQVRGGTAFNEAAQQYVAETAQAQYADPEYAHYTNVGSAISASSYGEWLTSSTHKANDVGVVEEAGGTGYYVVQYLNSYLDKETVYSVDVRHILVKAETTEPEPTPAPSESVEPSETTAPESTAPVEPTEEQYAAAKAKIEEIQAEFEAGDKTPEAFGALAEKYSEDPGSNGSNVDNGGGSGGLYEGVTHNQMFSGFDAWIFDASRKPGDLGIVQNTQTDQWGYHLIYFQGTGPLTWKHNAQTTMQADAYQEWYDGIVGDYTTAAVDKGMGML